MIVVSTNNNRSVCPDEVHYLCGFGTEVHQVSEDPQLCVCFRQCVQGFVVSMHIRNDNDLHSFLFATFLGFFRLSAMTPRQRIPCQESSAVPGSTAGGTAVNGERLHQLLHRYFTTDEDKSPQFKTAVTIRSGRNSGVRIRAVELQIPACPPHRTRILLHTPALYRWS